MDSDAVSTGHQASSPSRCPSIGLLGTEFVPERLPVSERVCLAKPRRPWSPGTDTQASLCLTPEFGRCSHLAEETDSPTVAVAREERNEPFAPADDNILKWFGVAAAGCAVGVVITVAMFLFLATPVYEPNDSLESVVAPLVVEPSAPLDDSASAATPQQDETGEASHDADPPWLLNRLDGAPTVSQAVESEPILEIAPTARFARGAPADNGEQTHLVVEGETLWEIATNSGVDPGDLAARNGLASDDLIVAGDALVIPSATAENQP